MRLCVHGEDARALGHNGGFSSDLGGVEGAALGEGVGSEGGIVDEVYVPEEFHIFVGLVVGEAGNVGSLYEPGLFYGVVYDLFESVDVSAHGGFGLLHGSDVLELCVEVGSNKGGLLVERRALESVVVGDENRVGYRVIEDTNVVVTANENDSRSLFGGVSVVPAGIHVNGTVDLVVGLGNAHKGPVVADNGSGRRSRGSDCDQSEEQAESAFHCRRREYGN